MDPWVAIAGAGGTAPAGQGWNGPDLARGFVLPPEPSIGDLAGYDWSGPGGGSDGGEGSGDGSGGDDSGDAKETVVVRGTPEDNSMDGPIFHPMLDIGIVVGGGLPVDEVIIQRPPDVGDDGGWVDGGDGGRWDSLPVETALTPKQQRCCECLNAANPGDSQDKKGKAAIWKIFCGTIVDPALYAKCMQYATTGSRPQERDNFCFLDSRICPDGDRPDCPDPLLPP